MDDDESNHSRASTSLSSKTSSISRAGKRSISKVLVDGDYFREESIGTEKRLCCNVCQPAQLESFDVGRKELKGVLLVRPSGTSNLQRHMQRFHPDTFDKVQVAVDDTRDGFWRRNNNAAHRQLAQCLLTAGVKTSLVESADFRTFVGMIRKLPDYILPGRNFMAEKAMPDVYNCCKEKVTEAMRVADSVSIPLDIWSDKRRRSWLGVYACGECNGETTAFLLDLVRLRGEHSAAVIRHEVDKVAQRFGISGKISMVITDSGYNVRAAFPEGPLSFAGFAEADDAVGSLMLEFDDDAFDDEPNSENDVEAWRVALESLADSTVVADKRIYGRRCFAHLLQLAIVGCRGCMKELGPITSSAKKTVKAALLYYSHSNLATDRLDEMWHKHLLSVGKTRWDSDYLAIEAVLEIPFEIWEDVFSDFKLTTVEREHLQDLLRILQPVHKATVMLQGESYCTAQLMAPHVCRILEEVKNMIVLADVDPVRLQLQAEVERRLLPIAQADLQQAATYLDPFFRDRQHLWMKGGVDDTKNVVIRLASAIQLVNERSELSTQSVPETADHESSLWGKATSGPGYTAPVKTIRNEVDEYSKFALSGPIHCADNKEVSDLPRFWHEHASRFPGIARLARVILCVPATEAACERVFSRAGRILRQLGPYLGDNTLRRRLFVASNREVL